MRKSKKTKNDFLNGSGCKDFTAYEAIRNVQREEQKQLIADMVELAASRGYEIASVIRLEEIDDTGGR